MTSFWSKYTRRQWITIFVFAVADFCSAICVSLQAPFYPQEAEKKGATATEYGLVFGVFELTVFIVSPILGKNLSRFGAKRVFNIGILTTGTCSILFGLLDRIESRAGFIGTSFVVRAIEAVGNSGFLTASFSIIAKEFPESVATMFASLETFFGIGLIVGPSVGGALYQAGGYTLPFAALGALLICAAVMTHFVLPSKYDEKVSDTEEGQRKGMLDALKIPAIALAAYSILCASITIGFIQATLEPHLRQFGLSPVMMGVMFVVNGGVYAVCAPIWGYMCDKKVPPIFITAIGSLFITVSFMFIGPAPFIPLPTIYEVCVAMLVVHGIGFAAELVAGFSSAHREAVRNGFPDNLDTYALISGLWTATFALGACIGPTVAGFLVDYFHFRNATLFVVASQISVLLISGMFMFKQYKAAKLQREYAELDGDVVDEATTLLASRSPSPDYDSFSSESPIDEGGISISPDSGSYTDHSAVDIAAKLRADQDRFCRRVQVSSRRPPTQRVPRQRARGISSTSFDGARGRRQVDHHIFSPLSSPYEQSAVSLLGGMMGISVPTRMNNIFEEQIDAVTDHHQIHPARGQESRRQRSLTSPGRQHNKPSDTTTVTAIVEGHQPQMRDSGNIA